MHKTILFFFKRVIPFVYSLLLFVSLSTYLIAAEKGNALDFSFEKLYALKQSNIKRANELIQKLYCVGLDDFTDIFSGSNAYLEVGTQAGYNAKAGSSQANGPLILFKRVWAYDAGIALSLAVRNKDSTADYRARWLLKNGQYTIDPKNPDNSLFAGWPFSMNQAKYGDNWTDCRFITGANAYALKGIADYITSDYFQNLDKTAQTAYKKFYASALAGILYHIQRHGPNQYLLTAGWSLNVLEDYSETSYSYNRILNTLGYGPTQIPGYSNPIQRVVAENVVTEHCNNVLLLLNYTLDNYNKLMGANFPYSYNQLNAIRKTLRDTIFDKLYDDTKRRFISGRTAAGKPSNYTSIDNASWLSLSLKLDELSDKQVSQLSDSLAYTINNFTKDFDIKGKTYFGAHYFQDGYEDVYIVKSDSHSEALQMEATCGLICALLKFANAYPDDPNSPLFRSTATRLWNNLQHLVNNFGFIYASTSLKDVSEPLVASVSAIWYLKTCNFFKEMYSPNNL